MILATLCCFNWGPHGAITGVQSLEATLSKLMWPSRLWAGDMVVHTKHTTAYATEHVFDMAHGVQVTTLSLPHVTDYSRQLILVSFTRIIIQSFSRCSVPYSRH